MSRPKDTKLSSKSASKSSKVKLGSDEDSSPREEPQSKHSRSTLEEEVVRSYSADFRRSPGKGKSSAKGSVKSSKSAWGTETDKAKGTLWLADKEPNFDKLKHKRNLYTSAPLCDIRHESESMEWEPELPPRCPNTTETVTVEPELDGACGGSDYPSGITEKSGDKKKKKKKLFQRLRKNKPDPDSEKPFDELNQPNPSDGLHAISVHMPCKTGEHPAPPLTDILNEPTSVTDDNKTEKKKKKNKRKTKKTYEHLETPAVHAANPEGSRVPEISKTMEVAADECACAIGCSAKSTSLVGSVLSKKKTTEAETPNPPTSSKRKKKKKKKRDSLGEMGEATATTTASSLTEKDKTMVDATSECPVSKKDETSLESTETRKLVLGTSESPTSSLGKEIANIDLSSAYPTSGESVKMKLNKEISEVISGSVDIDEISLDAKTHETEGRSADTSVFISTTECKTVLSGGFTLDDKVLDTRNPVDVSEVTSDHPFVEATEYDVTASKTDLVIDDTVLDEASETDIIDSFGIDSGLPTTPAIGLDYDPVSDGILPTTGEALEEKAGDYPEESEYDSGLISITAPESVLVTRADGPLPDATPDSSPEAEAVLFSDPSETVPMDVDVKEPPSDDVASPTAIVDEYGLDEAAALVEEPGEWVPTVFKENPTETELAREEAIPYNPIRSYAELTGAEEAEFVPVADTSGMSFMSKVRKPKYGENCVLVRVDVRLWEGVVKIFGIRIRVLVEHSKCTLHEEDIENNWYKINLVFNGEKMEDVERVADKICLLYNGYRHDAKKRKSRYRFENAVRGEDPTCLPTPPSSDDEESKTEVDSVSFGPDSSSTMTKMVDDLQVRIYTEDLTKFRGDAIVCPTDYEVSCSAGISHAVVRRGGESVKKDIKRFKRDYGNLECASVMHTTAGDLPHRYVLFTVGPSWRYKDSKQCFKDLEDTVQNCLRYANDSLRLKSIAIPAISAGAQGGPMDMVAEAMKMGVYNYARTIRSKRKLKHICFINIDPVMTGLIQEAFATEDSRYCARVAFMFSGGLHFGREEDKPIYQAILSTAPDPSPPPIFPEETPPPPPEVEEDCPICISPMERRTTLKCGHSFCKDCVTKAFENKPTCPICQRSYGLVVGSQPINAEMQVEERHDESLPGFEGYGIIVITYHIADGVQGPEHPNPGQIFEGTVRQGFLPANPEGRSILRMLRIAFDRRLVFTVGRSATTGRENVVIWNDIHHKTNMQGGPERFGYPDTQYLERVKYELACKGIS